MAEHPDPTPATDGSSADRTTTDEILAVIAAGEPHGATADQVARASERGLDADLVQSEMEELVARGLLEMCVVRR